MMTRDTLNFNQTLQVRIDDAIDEKIEEIADALCPHWKGEGSNRSEAVRMAVDRIHEALVRCEERTDILDDRVNTREPQFRRWLRNQLKT